MISDLVLKVTKYTRRIIKLPFTKGSITRLSFSLNSTKTLYNPPHLALFHSQPSVMFMVHAYSSYCLPGISSRDCSMSVAVVQECILTGPAMLGVDDTEFSTAVAALNTSPWQHSWLKIIMSCPKHPDGQ